MHASATPEQDQAGLDYDVVVVGAGPVGVTLGLLAHAHGARTIVLDRATEVHPLPRAVHLDDEAVRILADAGAGDLADLRSPIIGMSLVDAQGRTLAAIDRHPGPGPLGFPSSSLVHQPAVEHRLRAAADRRALLALGQDVVGHLEHRSHVEVVVAQADGPVRTLRAGWLVGCDGAGGDTRLRAGFADEDLGFSQRWAVIDFLLEQASAHPARVLQVCDPTAPATSVPVAAGRHRIETRVAEDRVQEEALAEACAWGRAWLGDPHARVERAALYRFRARVADPMGRGRILLAGDAAHEMPPFLGQGLCSGLRDAANLGWKLGCVAQGRAHPDLLASYDLERRPHVREVVAAARRLGRVVGQRGRVRGWVRDQAVRVGERALRSRSLGSLGLPALPAGPLVDADTPAAGRPCPRPFVTSEGIRRPLDEALGRGFAVLGIGTDPRAGLPVLLRRRWEDLGARFIAVDADPRDAAGAHVMSDTSGALGAWAADLGVDLVVVRPDRIVLGAYTAPPARGASSDGSAAPARLSPLAGVLAGLGEVGLPAERTTGRTPS